MTPPESEPLWTEPGAWPVAPGVHRIPLPLPMDGLRAVNVYVLETDEGLTLVDGGWAIDEARQLLEKSLADLGRGLGDITRFLVTHVHRDHYTQAVTVRREFGSHVSLGVGDKPTLDLILDREASTADPHVQVLRDAGAARIALAWEQYSRDIKPDLTVWAYPDAWLDGDHPIPVGDRVLDAGHTTCSRTAVPGCCSPVTTCFRGSRRPSGSSRCSPTSRWATSSARSPRSARCRT